MLLNYSNCILVLFVPAWNIALISGVLPLILLFLIGLNQRLSAWSVIPSWPRLLTLCLFGARWLHYLSSTAITLVTAMMNWPPVFHLQWLGPLNIQPVVVVRGLKRQQVAASTNFVGCFFSLYLISFFSFLGAEWPCRSQCWAFGPKNIFHSIAMARPRSTRRATFAHNYCVELSNARINRFSDGFFPSTSHLWNSLPSSVFPASFNLPSFKRQVYYHLRDQMAWFFLLHFLYIL